MADQRIMQTGLMGDPLQTMQMAQRLRLLRDMKAAESDPRRFTDKRLMELSGQARAAGMDIGRLEEADIGASTGGEQLKAIFGGIADAAFLGLIPDSLYTSHRTSKTGKTAKDIAGWAILAAAIASTVLTGGATAPLAGAAAKGKIGAKLGSALGKVAGYTPTGKVAKSLGTGIKAGFAKTGVKHTAKAADIVGKTMGAKDLTALAAKPEVGSAVKNILGKGAKHTLTSNDMGKAIKMFLDGGLTPEHSMQFANAVLGKSPSMISQAMGGLQGTIGGKLGVLAPAGGFLMGKELLKPEQPSPYQPNMFPMPQQMIPMPPMGLMGQMSPR